MDGIDYEAEYNNRRRVPEHPAIMARWAEASQRARSVLASTLDVPYGPGPRQRYDLFAADPADADAPLLVYIHGGYWQRGDRSEYSFIAEPFVAGGARVAIPSYGLCPGTTVAAIVDEIRLFLARLWRDVSRRPVVVGHSAGGHLAAAMLATDWSRYGEVPADLVRAACGISGVYDLAPLVRTSINEALGLDLPAARAASPLLWPAPAGDRTFLAAVGGEESGEFVRQSREIARVWSAAGVRAECMVVPGADHFTVIDELARTPGALFRQVLQLASP